MGWNNPLSRLFGQRPDKKSSRGGALLVPFGAQQARFTPRQYDQLAAEGYQKNIIAYRCIRLISQNAAAVPFAVFRGKGKNRQRLEEHPLLSLLQSPNPVQGGAELFGAIFGFYLIAGNSYIEAVGPDGEMPRELWTLRPDRMRIIPGPAGIPAAYRYSVNGKAIDFPVDNLTGQSSLLHVKTFHPLDAMTINNQPVDNTTMADNGLQGLQSDAGVQSLQIRLEGLFKDDAAEEALRAAAFGRSKKNYELLFPNGDKYAAAFVVQDYTRGGAFDGLETFQLTLLRSSGGTFTPGT